MGFSRQEYWSGLPFPPPGDLPDPGIKPGSPAFQADALTSEPPGTPERQYTDICQQSDIFAFEYVPLGFIIAFLPGIQCILILCLQLPSTVILETKKEKSATASTFSPSICHEVMELDAMIFVFQMLGFKPAFSPSSRGSFVPLHFLSLEW